MSNILPKALVELHRAAALPQANEIETALKPLFECVGVLVKNTRTLPNGEQLEVNDKFRNPAPVKTMMAGLGMMSPVSRAPLGKMTHNAVERCRTALIAVYERRPDWFAALGAAFEVDVNARLRDDAMWRALGR